MELEVSLSCGCNEPQGPTELSTPVSTDKAETPSDVQSPGYKSLYLRDMGVAVPLDEHGELPMGWVPHIPKTLYRDANGVSVTRRQGFNTYGIHLDRSPETLDVLIPFQNGPISEGSLPNGVTNEALIAVLIDRIGALNEKFSCAENVLAIESLTTALNALDARTFRRQLRGVEGKEVL